MKYKLLLFILVLNLTLVSSMEVCSDSNSIDINDIPCVGLTNVVNCTGNISVTNVNTTEQFNITTNDFGDGRLNFTVNFTEGTYSLVDCGNNSASIIIGIIDQGYGINLFSIMIPSILLIFGCLFISGRMFHRMSEGDEHDKEEIMESESNEDFVPRSRLMPIIFLLFSFIPLLFLFGFVENHLNIYLSGANVTAFYGQVIVMLMVVFIGTFLISILIWLAHWIDNRNVLRGFGE